MFSSHQGLKCIWQLLKNTSEIWKNHIFTVRPGSSSIQVHWEFCCVFFQALYWITLSIKSSYFYAEPLPWPVFRNLYVYTEKILLCSKGASVAVVWNFVEKKENLILLVLVLLFWGLVYFLVVLGVSFGIQTGDITSVRASQASQHHTEPTLQIMWGMEMENNKMKLWVTAEPKDRRQASLVPSALSLPLENMTVPCDLGERSTSFAFSSSNLGGRQRC